MCRLNEDVLDHRIYPTSAMVHGFVTQEEHIEGLIEYLVEEWTCNRRCDSVMMEYLFGEAVHRAREAEEKEEQRVRQVLESSPKFGPGQPFWDT